MASSHSQTKATREAHQSPSECCSPTGSVDESFVVLINEIQEASPKAESKLPLLQPGINAESLEQTTLQSSSTVPQIEANCAAKPLERSTTYDELHNKIELLLMQLITQSITQNNTVLKSQCETLLKWQGDVHKVHKFHRSKFVDAAQIIKQLKDENNRLKHMHQTVSTPPKHGDNSIIMKEVADLKDELQKADELLTRHVEEISSLKDTLATVADEKAQLEKSHDDLSAKLSTLTKIHSMQSVELFNMKSSNSMDMISLQEKLENSKFALEQQEERCKRLNDEMTGIKEQNLKLFNNLQDFQTEVAAKDVVIVKLKKEKTKESNFDELQKEMLRVKGRLFDKINEVGKLKEEIRQLNEEIDVLNAEIEQNQEMSAEHDLLKKKACDLSKQIDQNVLTIKELEAAITHASDKEDKLLAEITLLKVRSTEPDEEMQQLRTKLQMAQSQIVHLKEAKKIVEESDQGTIAELKYQMDLCRNEYQAERYMKIRATEELNKVSHDLSNMMKYNHTLIEKIQTLRHIYKVPKPANAEQPPTLLSSQYRCPICSSKFQSVGAVREHLDMCVNNRR